MRRGVTSSGSAVFQRFQSFQRCQPRLGQYPSRRRGRWGAARRMAERIRATVSEGPDPVRGAGRSDRQPQGCAEARQPVKDHRLTGRRWAASTHRGYGSPCIAGVSKIAYACATFFGLQWRSGPQRSTVGASLSYAQDRARRSGDPRVAIAAVVVQRPLAAPYSAASDRVWGTERQPAHRWGADEIACG